MSSMPGVERGACALAVCFALAACGGSSEDGASVAAAGEPATQAVPVDDVPDGAAPTDAMPEGEAPVPQPDATDPEPTPDPPPLNDPSADDPSAITSAQLAAIGIGCIDALDAAGIAYGYCPATRTLSAVAPDGAVRWSFALPGDDATNRVDAIGVTGAADAPLVIAARTVGADGTIAHEISRFDLDGGFVETLPILASPRFADHLPTVPRDTNLDDEPLAAVADGDRLIVAGTRYGTLDGGDPAQRSDRFAAGGFATSVDVTTGDTLAYRAFDGADVTSLDVAATGTVDIAVAPPGGAASPTRYATDTLVVAGAALSLPALDADTATAVLPTLYEAMRLDRLERLGARLESLTGLLDVDVAVVPPTCPPSTSSTAYCGYDETTDPVSVECPSGGEASVSASASDEFRLGSGIYRTSGRTWRFDGCALDVTGVDGLADGRYAIDGGYATDAGGGAVRRGEREYHAFSLDGLTLLRPDGSREGAAAAARRVGSGSNFGTTPVRFESVEASLDGYDDGRVRITDARYERRDERRSQDGADGFDLTSVGGALTRAAPDTGGRALRLEIAPPLVGAAPGAIGLETSFEGVLTLSTDTGSVTVEPVTDGGEFGVGSLAYRFRDGTDVVKPFASLLLPWFR